MSRHGHRSRDGYNPTDKVYDSELVAGQWIKSAEHDLAVANTLFLAGHYNWTSFACQQALEKLLKAGYVRTRHKIPPHVHKLERLSAIMKLDPPEEHIENLIEINQCYTSTRYPSYKNDVCGRTREESADILDKTWKTFIWLRQELQL